jgi:pilus assembly protein CpaE
MAHLSCLIFAETELERAEVTLRVESTGHVGLVRSLGDPRKLGAEVRAARADVLLAVLGKEAEGTLDAIEALPQPRPALVFSGPSERSELILRAMHLGAREYFPELPEQAELATFLDQLLLEPGTSGKRDAAGALVGVLGAKGGVGATVVTCQLAGELQAAGCATCVVDLDLRDGDVALHYNVEPPYSLADVAQTSNRVDAAYLKSVAHVHSSGTSVITAPQRPEEAELIRTHHLEWVLEILRSQYEFVLVDLPRAWDEASLGTLDLLDQLLVVFGTDLPSLAHTRQHLELLARIEFPLRRIRLVANRHQRSNGVSDRETARFLGRAPDIRIPNDYLSVMESIASGKLLSQSAPRSAVHRAFRELAYHTREWCGRAAPDEKPAGKGGISMVRSLIRRRRNGAD